MLRLSTLFLLSCSILAAQTDIIVRKLILRDAADTKFWTLSQDPADTTTILLTDDTGSLRMDWDAQDGVQFFNHILPGADDTYTLGTTNIRFGTGFATVWNGEILRIENAAHTAHFGLIHDAAGLKFLDTSDLQMFLLEPSGGNSVLNSSLIPHADKTNRLGTTLLRWDPIHGESIIAYDAFVVESGDAARYVTCNDTTFNWPLCTVTGEWDSSGGTGGDVRSSAFYLANAAGSIRVNMFVEFDNGTIDLTNDIGNIVAVLDTTGRSGGENDSGHLELKDRAGSSKITLGFQSLKDPFLTLVETTSGDSVFLLASASLQTGVWIDGSIKLAKDELILQPDQSTGDGTGANLIGISYDGADALEASNLVISPSDGNFYLRPISGDIDCTAGVGGVEDGWIGIQTTTKELQHCSGALTRVTPSVAIGDTPSTVTCTSGQVLINAVIKNGIIIGGTCAAN